MLADFQTDNDASNSRQSAVALGYLNDTFSSAFATPEVQASRRYPIINRGTYVRTKAIDKLVKDFLGLRPNEKKQIISLGAGSDTRFFRLANEETISAKIVYHELDFEANVARKRACIRQSPQLEAVISQARSSGSEYHLHALDLRDLTNKSPPIIPGLDSDLPTLLLSECCLCYLPPDTATSVLQYFTMNLKSSLALALYEPIRPYDAFGRTMVTNLASRGIHLQTLKQYSSLEAQRQRLKLAGFDTSQGARDVYQIYRNEDWVSAKERERVEALEWLDEIEEWKLLASHYCIAWGWRGEAFTDAWTSIEGDRTPDEDRDAGG
ncbi:carboxy methyl transferase for protein phosphatase 2A [Recurvomyces mirabilis]|nr:carboxy methyl transferase for protein phosphatase 2A [Recurvomyces mirabilis]